MSLRTKLTLGAVLLATLIVGAISAVELINDMQRQFEATYDRADLLKRVANKMVVQALERQRTAPLEEALRDPTLTSALIDIGAASRVVFEIAVVSPHNEIWADSDPSRLNSILTPLPDFAPLALRTGWATKLKVLRETGKYYQLQEALGPQGGAPLLYVRVIIEPSLIADDILPTMYNNGKLALASIAGAILITFAFSAVAFRPLGELRHMLDLVARGEYDPASAAPPKPAARDEVSIIASKVSLLGQRLRGAESEVLDLRGNFERLLHDLEGAVFLFSREQRLIFASGAVEKFIGRSRYELTGLGLAEIFPQSTMLGLLVAQAAQTQRSITNRRVPAGGDPAATPAVVLVSVDLIEPLSSAPRTGAGFIVRLRDPETTRQLGRQLQTADRMAAISRITGGVAHEVKNPLNAMLLHVEVAKSKLAKGDCNVTGEMEIISREILRLDRVVKTFLDFTRPVELNVSSVPLGAFLGELADLARPQAQAAGIALHVNGEVEGVEVRIDRDLMKQALWNIVVNAIEAMQSGGELHFSAHTVEDGAEVRIADTGAGIPPELREKIFSLYFTTKQRGSGIGLAMTFRIVQLHDGTIDFTSEPGKGTTFLVRLPTAV
jgi:signal transduction histidine kinase